MLHPGETPRVPYVTQCLKDAPGVLVAASDYVKAMPDSIDRWLPRPITALGTDGFGRSENRAALREFFEVDYRYVVVATLSALARDGKIDATVVAAGDQGAQHQSREGNPANLVTKLPHGGHRLESGSIRYSCLPVLREHFASRGLYVTDFTLPELGENITAGDVLRCWSSRATRSRKISRSSSSKPTRRRSKCPRRSPARSKRSRSRPATRSKSARRSSASTRAAAGSRRRSRRSEGAGKAEGRRAEGSTAKAASKARREQPARAKTRAARRRGERPVQQAGQAGVKDPTVGRGRGAATRARRRSSTSPRRARRRRKPRRAGDAAGARRAVGPPHGARARRRHQRVQGTGADGRISVEDVKEHAQAAGRRRGASAARPRRGAPLPDFSRWGAVERQPMRAVRRKTAEHLERRVGDDSARHAARSRRHHRARGAAQEIREAGRSGRRQPHGDRDRVKVIAAALKAVSAVQRVDRPGRRARSSTRNTSTSASRWTPIAACSCR